MLVQTKLRNVDWLESKAECSDVKEKADQWKRLWKVKVPSKIRVFAWRLALNSIPVNAVLKSRNMAKSAVCKICGAEKDTWRHALFVCNMSRCVWALVDEELTEHLAETKEDDPKLWLFSLLDSLHHHDFVKLLITCWAIWGARRKVIHDNFFQSPLSTYAIIKRLLEDMNIYESATDKRMKDKEKTTVPRWLAPPSNFMKINVDGAVARTGRSGAVGAICRNSQGVFISASARVFDGI